MLCGSPDQDCSGCAPAARNTSEESNDVSHPPWSAGNQCCNCGAILASRRLLTNTPERLCGTRFLSSFTWQGKPIATNCEISSDVLYSLRSTVCQKMTRRLLTWLHIFAHSPHVVTWFGNHLTMHVVGTCLALHQNPPDATGQNAIKGFLDAHPPKDKKLAAAVRACEILSPPQPCVQHVRDNYHDGTRAKRRQTVRTGPTWQPPTKSS